ncbi:hypothetical protein HF319_18745 [Xanthomonas sp. Kuri4-1]
MASWSRWAVAGDARRGGPPTGRPTVVEPRGRRINPKVLTTWPRRPRASRAPHSGASGAQSFTLSLDGTSTPWLAWLAPVCWVVGVLLLFATMHLARGLGRLHGLIAKHLLVRLD